MDLNFSVISRQAQFNNPMTARMQVPYSTVDEGRTSTFYAGEREMAHDNAFENPTGIRGDARAIDSLCRGPTCL